MKRLILTSLSVLFAAAAAPSAIAAPQAPAETEGEGRQLKHTYVEDEYDEDKDSVNPFIDRADSNRYVEPADLSKHTYVEDEYDEDKDSVSPFIDRADSRR